MPQPVPRAPVATATAPASAEGRRRTEGYPMATFDLSQARRQVTINDPNRVAFGRHWHR